ncbi:unnamed protein product [Rotaria sp. Silwood2]|nr:unnamed protein product [Rotaria sp. Silwood2]CAF2708967.1 unnamed protein product [Rotaria sp. Silwood2]CAF2973642.1 unnamed protein product [Rotaria sp. Silwood2]CAF3119096.1 unnamed protein product [Rotaria sp. Silwood2]CAF3864378.1 unnamed protein product [Rotaria sp. Silwood2]
MYENISIPTSFVYPYETISSSPVRSSYENNTQQPVYVSLEPNLPDQIKTISKNNTNALSIIPLFQRKFPIVTVAILGFFELFAGLIVLTLELFTFDIALGLWCGAIYALAGAAIIVLVIVTDRERHQTSVVLIFQFIALIFTIIEILLHSDLYRKRCITKPSEPTRELASHCKIAIIQMAAATLVFGSTIVFSIIYFRVTMVLLKQPHGTFNMSNVINLTTC